MRNKAFIVLLVALTATLWGSFQASAQRTAYGERLLTLSGTASPRSAYGVTAEFGQYLLKSYWTGGLVLEDRLKRHVSGQPFGNARVEGFGSYMYRIYGTRNRQLSAYVGGDLFLGFEFLDPFKQLDEPTWNSMLNDGYKEYRFIYGISPRATVEFFVTGDLALTAGIRIPVTLNGAFKQDLVDFAGLLGIRYNF